MSTSKYVSFDASPALPAFIRWPPPVSPVPLVPARSARRPGPCSAVFILFLALALVVGISTRPDLPSQRIASQLAVAADGPRQQILDVLATQFFRSIDASTLSSVRVDDIPTVLNDPYTHYLTPLDYQKLTDVELGQYVGVGVDVGAHNGSFRIDRVVPTSPAALAGVEVGDLVRAVDGVDVQSKTLEQTLALIRGPEGRNVQLAVQRSGVTTQFTMTRVTMREGMVLHELRAVHGHSVGLLSLLDFSEGVGKKARSAVREMIDAGAEGIVVDLRGNPGGWAVEALRVAEIFLPEGAPVLTERGAHIDVKTFSTRFRPEDITIPVALLVDHLTASSAEIVAGAMRDNGRAKLVGETTFGKGRIQDIVELDGGGAFKFTYAEYLTPNGFALDGVGLTPDIAARPEQTSVLDPSFNTAVETMFGILR